MRGRGNYKKEFPTSCVINTCLCVWRNIFLMFHRNKKREQIFRFKKCVNNFFRPCERMLLWRLCKMCHLQLNVAAAVDAWKVFFPSSCKLYLLDFVPFHSKYRNVMEGHVINTQASKCDTQNLEILSLRSHQLPAHTKKKSN